MIGYSATTVFPESAKTFLAIVQSVVDALPEEDGLRCHEVVRVVARWVSRQLGMIEVCDGRPKSDDSDPWGSRELLTLGGKVRQRLYVIDGSYGMPDGPRIEHSWLLTRFYRTDRNAWMVALVDPYAVGRLLPVQMLDMNLTLGGMYWGGPARADIQQDTIERLAAMVEARIPT